MSAADHTDDFRRNPDGVLCDTKGSIGISDGDTDLQLRLCFIFHTVLSGNSAPSTTDDIIFHHLVLTALSADTDIFVRSCIYFVSTLVGGEVPHPYGPSLHGTVSHVLLQFDYIEITEDISVEKYVLMLRDDHSNYFWFFAFPETPAENAARSVVDWCAASGVTSSLMSDGQTHFKNEKVRLIPKVLRLSHHFGLPYTHWINGGVERLRRELLRVFRPVTSELRLEYV